MQIYGELRIGRDVKVSSGCLLAVSPGATLTIEDNVFVGRQTVIVAADSISIGRGTDIAEHCTIRDSDHAVTLEGRANGRDNKSPVRIGRHCWLGAGVRVLRGVTLGDDVVVGANAVVRQSFPSQTLVAGVPARLIRQLHHATVAPETLRADE